LYLPESALLGSGDDGKVWALDASGTKVEQRNLRLGQDRRDGHIEVLEGLRPGDWIVNDPPPDLKDGERVRKVEP
jgi:multidrug efflux pump subunit AcrA (membrane-fusion protein)